VRKAAATPRIQPYIPTPEWDAKAASRIASLE
jgi:hypothetical protein